MRNLTIKEAQRKSKKHLKWAREYLPYLTERHKKKNPEQYFHDVMSCRSLAMQAHSFSPSYKTEKLLKLLETK